MRVENCTTGGRSVSATLHFGKETLKITKTNFGTVLQLADFKVTGVPGAPALPVKELRVAVPQPLWPGSVKIVKEQWVCVSEASTFVVPIQERRPGGGEHHDTKGEHHDTKTLHCSPDCSCRKPQRPDRAPGTEEPWAAPPYTPPNPDAYADAIKSPAPVISAMGLETVASTNIAVIEVAPVRFSPKGEVLLCTSVQLEIETLEKPSMLDKNEALAEFKKLYKNFDPKRVVAPPEPFISGQAEADRLRNVAQQLVINPDLIGRIRRDWPIFDFPTDYLIITDDVTWDAEAITPDAPRPGIIAAFERLALAKRARGVLARVVTITNIVNGSYGDFRTGSRDLQEVIRRFLKRVRSRWGVQWLLLGGDVSIIPMRTVSGSMLGRVEGPGTNDPPPERFSFWTGSHLRIHATPPDKYTSANVDSQLIRTDTGALIPYDVAGTSNSTTPGWYFCSADDYATRTTFATDFVRVEGPERLVNGPMRFLTDVNTIPTDFYYASLSSWVIRPRVFGRGIFSFRLPWVYIPEHDWDASGEGVYGSFNDEGNNLDGVIFKADLSVGRAPVEYDTEANTFVNKTLAYERLGATSWLRGNRDWPRKMVFAAEDWTWRIFIQSTGAATPRARQYVHDATNFHSLLRLDEAPTTWEWNLIARVADNDRRILPWKRDTRSTVRGWYFATSATDLTERTLRLPAPWSNTRIPLMSEWIVVHGPVAERTPPRYEWNQPTPDGSMSDQESLRVQIGNELPGINRIERYYEDEFDLTSDQRVAAHVDFLNSANLTSALNAAPHIVSLSGHGSSNGCCKLSRALARSLTNGFPGFIGYADSCLTNDNQVNDAMGEELITNDKGGAVAYVGNTRFSWIGAGDDFQRAFFHRLVATRHLGQLNDSKVTATALTGRAHHDRWQVFSLTLLGDPELRVYKTGLPPLVIRPGRVSLLKPIIRVLVDQRPPTGPPLPGKPSPIKGVLVHVRQGKSEWTGSTDAEGRVELPEGKFTKGDLEVTASHEEYAVAVERFQVEDDRPVVPK